MNRVLDALPLVAAVAIVGAGLYALLDKAAPIVEVRPEPAKQAVVPSPSRSTYDPPPTAQERPVGPVIFRCESGGAVVYSDTPCGGGRVVDVQVTQGFEGERGRQPQTTPRVVEDAPTVSPAPSTGQSDGTTNAVLCEQIVKAIESIDAAARAGGTIQYMEDLKERRRKLVEKRQELRC